VHVVAILKKHLRNLKIITNVNVTCANRQKRHAKRIANKPSADFYKIEVGAFSIL
jgi:hypothetical protein